MIFKKFEDLLIPINEIYNNLNYRDIQTKNKINEIISKKKLIHTFDTDIDDLMLYSLNYYDNLNNFVIFGYNKEVSYKYYLKTFQEDYSLYGIKHINIPFSMVFKIMYQLLFPRMIIQNKYDLYNYIEANFNYLNKYDKEFIDITILVVCKKNLDKKYPSEDIVSNEHMVYIPNTKESIWITASLFFSESSLKFIEKQNFDYFLTRDMEESKKMFLRYRSWLFNNIDIKTQMQFMLFSSIVLYLLGHRAINDIDLYIHTISNEVQELVNEFSTNEKYKCIEYKIKNTENWPRYWDTWLDLWANKCGLKYFEEILGNPKYHFYFLGVKIISLECDIVRRLERQRPRAIADLIALRKRYSIKINIPPISNKKINYISTIEKSVDEITELLKNGGKLNEQNREIEVEENNDIDKTIKTIIYALNTRYRMTFTENEIKKELNMCFDDKIIDNKTIEKKIKISIRKKV